jgi:Family of unknown function (DUF5681)
MADNDDGNSNYPVGYKKPPRHTQFKAGQSGNAKGRPKGTQNFASVFEQELRTTIPVTENGQRKRISKRMAIAKQAVNKAAAGDHKAITTILNEARINDSQNQLPFAQAVAIRPEDQPVMKDLIQRIRQSDPACDGTAAPDPPSEGQVKSPNNPSENKGEL